jgi:hypothetical protein
MYSSPGSSSKRRSPHHKQIPEGPITDFLAVIEETPAKEWQRRVKSLETLVSKIPTGSAYSESGRQWYNTPPVLRHLALPAGELLRDPRSTVVKRACKQLTTLFQRCQYDGRYLFKDLMPVILQVHAQTVQVIRTAVQQFVLETIPETPCKMVMPLWMERLQRDKSRTVRDACALYLGAALQSWTEEGYLTEDIWMQVGQCLIRTLRDPSPAVRQHARTALERIHREHPVKWEALLNDPTGPAARDPKLMRVLRNVGTAGDDEELTIASRFSYNSDARFASGGGVPAMRISSPRAVQFGSAASADSDERQGAYAIPTAIAVKHKAPAASGGAGGGGLGPPVRPKAAAAPTARPFPQAEHSPPRRADYSSAAPPRTTTGSRSTPPRPPPPRVVPASSSQQQEEPLEYSESSHYQGNGIRSPEEEEQGPFIASIDELKRHASQRRSRSSILLQDRFRQSSSFSERDGYIAAPSSPVTNRSPVPNPSPAQPPEHMVIAVRLLRAHKSHVDTIMETLKMEMDCLRDFDRLLEEPGRPTEEEVLQYFESVGLCLEQRQAASTQLQREMDLISTGEPPAAGAEPSP